MRRPRVLITGWPYFATMLSALLTNEAIDFIDGSGIRSHWRLYAKLFRSDAVYSIGSTVYPTPFARIARLLRKPTVSHWVGTDVLLARADVQAGRAAPWRIHGRNALHWTEVPWIAEEMKEIGVSAEVVPLTSSRFPDVVPPLPRGPLTLLGYICASRADFYGAQTVLQIARELPDVRVLVVSPRDDVWRGPELSNLECLGFQTDMTAIYARVHALLRMTEHDGLSFMAVEAAAHGRYLLWTHPFGPMPAVRTYDDAAAEVGRLRDLQQSGRLEPNTLGANWVREHLSPRAVAADIRSRFLALFAERGSGPAALHS